MVQFTIGGGGGGGRLHHGFRGYRGFEIWADYFGEKRDIEGGGGWGGLRGGKLRVRVGRAGHGRDVAPGYEHMDLWKYTEVERFWAFLYTGLQKSSKGQDLERGGGWERGVGVRFKSERQYERKVMS